MVFNVSNMASVLYAFPHGRFPSRSLIYRWSKSRDTSQGVLLDKKDTWVRIDPGRSLSVEQIVSSQSVVSPHDNVWLVDPPQGWDSRL